MFKRSKWNSHDWIKMSRFIIVHYSWHWSRILGYLAKTQYRQRIVRNSYRFLMKEECAPLHLNWNEIAASTTMAAWISKSDFCSGSIKKREKICVKIATYNKKVLAKYRLVSVMLDYLNDLVNWLKAAALRRILWMGLGYDDFQSVA